jgi:creatinine amidohydrolase
MDLVSDICRSFARNGIERVLLLNTGVSTTGPLRVVVRELNSELPDCLVGLMNLVELGREEIEAELEQPGGSHADEMETSLILSIDEKLVKLERAGEELEATSSLQSIQTSSPLPIENAAGEEVSGIIGDATLASKKKGDSFWDLIFSNLEEIEDFLQGQ